MRLVEISNIDKRIIKFGISLPERYITSPEPDPWWKVYVLVDKPEIKFEAFSESMLQSELLDLVKLIEKSKTFEEGYMENFELLEPDYSFKIGKIYGSFIINMKYADSLCIYLTRENLDEIACYITDIINSD